MAVRTLSNQLVGVLDVYIQKYTTNSAFNTALALIALPTSGGVGAIVEYPSAADPTAGWFMLGPTDGEQAISHSGGLTYFRDNWGTGPTKAVRPEEDLTVTFTVVGLSLENYIYILSGGAPTTGGFVKTIGLVRGLIPTSYSMVMRGLTLSPYGSFPAQYIFPLGVFDGEPNPTFAKDGRAELEVEFHALEDTNQSTDKRFGWLEVRTQ